MAEGHVYYIAYKDGTPCGYLSVQPEAEDLYILQNLHPATIPGCARGELPLPQGYRTHQTAPPGSLPDGAPRNRHNKAVKFYERMGMRKLREGDFEIGGGFYMNDYIMGLEI